MEEDTRYTKTAIDEVIRIDSIVTVHYFEFASDYVYKGEKHNFWEFLYVDKGEVEILAGEAGYKLHHGDMVFHKPNEFHSVWANGTTAPNIVVISFECNSVSMSFFENRILRLSTNGRDLLSRMVKESREAFANNLDDPYTKLQIREPSSFGSRQMVKLYLEMFLIQLVREGSPVSSKDRLSSSVRERMEGDIIKHIIDFMDTNIDKHLSLEDICKRFSIGKTHLKTIFKNSVNQGVMTYFRNVKIEEAKRLIREGRDNFTQVSQKLGFDSVHYFSRAFKKTTGMSPTQYAVSVKARIYRESNF